jgi:hypothetical protein
VGAGLENHKTGSHNYISAASAGFFMQDQGGLVTIELIGIYLRPLLFCAYLRKADIKTIKEAAYKA